MQPINMIMIYYWDKKLKKRLHVLEADITKKNIDLMCLAQRMHILQDMFQMTAIVLVSVINHYHIDETSRPNLLKPQIPGRAKLILVVNDTNFH